MALCRKYTRALTFENAWQASDAWAYGCVVFQILAGHVPILGVQEDEETVGYAHTQTHSHIHTYTH